MRLDKFQHITLLDSTCRHEQIYVHAPEDIEEYVREIPNSTTVNLPRTTDCKYAGSSKKCTGAGENCPLNMSASTL